MNTPDVKHLPLKIIHDLAHPGEIMGITGLLGCGREALAAW